MRLLILTVSLWALAYGKPETYKEKEDFQFSRSSSDDGSKSGYYGAQRGNMGGNYEKAHNMDSLAQHQMSTLVRQVDGELGEGANTRTGSVFTAGNSRGVYGSGNYDLSNLKGRSFDEGVTYGDTHSSSSMSQNSGYHGNLYSGASNAQYSSNQLRGSGRSSDYETAALSSQYAQANNQQAESQYRDSSNYEYGRQGGSHYKYYSHGGSQARSDYDLSNTNMQSGINYDANTRSRTITSPVRVYVRPGTRAAIPVGAQIYDASQLSSISQDQTAVNSEAELLNADHRINVIKPAKHYESSYSYRKEWEKHDTKPAVTESPFPVNSELNEESQLSQAAGQQYQAEINSANAQLSRTNNAYSSNVNSAYSSGYNANTKSASSNRLRYLSQMQNSGASSASNTYDANSQNIGSDASVNLNSLDENSRPKSYQSSYAYHKSWERRGDPYVIKPIDSDINSQMSQRLMAASASQQGSHSYSQYGSQYKQQSYSQDDCDEHRRKRRSYNTDMFQPHQTINDDQEDLGQHIYGQWNNVEGQQLQNQWDNLEDLGQQTQHQWGNFEDLGQQTQNTWDNLETLNQQSQNQVNKFENGGQQNQDQKEKLEDLGQQTQNTWGSLENLGQQTQNTWDNLENFGQQIHDQKEKLEELGQQTQNTWDNLENFGQQTHNQGEKLEDLGQQTQNTWDNLETLNQQSQNQVNKFDNGGQQNQDQKEKLEDLGQQTQNTWGSLENLGQQTQNTWDNLENFGQQIHDQKKKLEELGQQNQNTWDNLENFGQQTQNQGDKLEDLGQQTQNTWDNLETLNQQSQDQVNKLENGGQENQDQKEKLENLGQETQNTWEGSGNLGQQTQNHVGKLEDLGQQTQNTWDNLENSGQQTQNKWDKFEVLDQQTQNQWDKTENLIPLTQSKLDAQEIPNKIEDLHQQTRNVEQMPTTNIEEIEKQTQDLIDFLKQFQHNKNNVHSDTHIHQQTQVSFDKEHMSPFDEIHNNWHQQDDFLQQGFNSGYHFSQAFTPSSHTYTLEQSNNKEPNFWDAVDKLINESEKKSDDSHEMTNFEIHKNWEESQTTINQNYHMDNSQQLDSDREVKETTTGQNELKPQQNNQTSFTDNVFRDQKLNISDETYNNGQSQDTIASHKINDPTDIGRGDIGPDDVSVISIESHSSSDTDKSTQNLQSLNLTTDLNTFAEKNEEPVVLDVIGLEEQHNLINTHKPQQYNNINSIPIVPIQYEQKENINLNQEPDLIDQQNLEQQFENVEQSSNWLDQSLVDFGQQEQIPETNFNENMQQFSQANLDHFENFEPQNTQMHYLNIQQDKSQNARSLDIPTKDNELQINDNMQKSSQVEIFENKDKDIQSKPEQPMEVVTEKPGFWKSVWGKTVSAKDSVVSWFKS